MYFDEKASEWDTEMRRERAKVLADSICLNIGKTEQFTGLEIGCGTGLISFELSTRFKKIYCVDTSVEMLRVLEDKKKAFGVGNIYPKGIDFLNETEIFGQIDLIFSSMVFHHIIDIDSELNLLHKHLKKNGKIIIIDLDKEDGRFHQDEKDFCGHNGFDRSLLQTLMEQNNFTNIEFITVYNGKKSLANEVIDYSLFMCTATKC